MFVRKSSPDTPVVLHRFTVEKHGSHNQASHGRKGGRGSGGSTSPSSRPTKESVIGEYRNNEKILQNASRMSAFSEKMRGKDSKVSNKAEEIAANLLQASNPSVNNKKHLELVTSAGKAFDKLPSATISNLGEGRSFNSISMQLNDYITKLNDELFFSQNPNSPLIQG